MLMPAQRVVIAHNEDKREQTVSEVRGHVCIFMSLPAAGNTRNYSARARARTRFRRSMGTVFKAN